MTVKMHDCKEKLRSVDLKATPARLEILKLLEASEKPIDVSSIIDYLSSKKINTDPATVFRIINMFTNRGLTRQIQLHEGRFRYELASKADHHHLICQKCGNIEDISDCSIDILEKEIDRKKGFRVSYHSLEFFGVCARCQS